MPVIISPSILGYERNMESHFNDIEIMLNAGIRDIHVDIMRKPFIPDRDAFSELSILRLYDCLGSSANLDFHLMVRYPEDLIKFIGEVVPFEGRENITITIHREAYRDFLGKYDSKEYDLLCVVGDNGQSTALIRSADNIIARRIYTILSHIKQIGFRTGLAFEPRTSLLNLNSGFLGVLDRVLLMSVSSGAGGQSYDHGVTEKIKMLKGIIGGYYPLEIQVDGGINADTIKEAVDAGADNLVIGSYITNAEDIERRVRGIKRLINQ